MKRKLALCALIHVGMAYHAAAFLGCAYGMPYAAAAILRGLSPVILFVAQNAR